MMTLHVITEISAHMISLEQLQAAAWALFKQFEPAELKDLAEEFAAAERATHEEDY